MRSISEQFRTLTPVMLISWLITLLLLLMAIFACTEKGIPLDYLTKDPTAIMNAPFYLGFFSNFGIVIWSCSAMICFLVAYRIKNNEYLEEEFYFILFSGLITLLMTLDDLYLLHETVFPFYLHIPENAVLLTYFNIYLLFFLRYKNRLLNSDFIALGLAFFFLGMSTLIKLFPMPIPQDTFMKDAFKLFGSVSWLIYFFRTGNELLDKQVR
ncbi:hypothetical protein BH11BAC2_BH11BAC2_26710 [soil metagenome]